MVEIYLSHLYLISDDKNFNHSHLCLYHKISFGSKRGGLKTRFHIVISMPSVIATKVDQQSTVFLITKVIYINILIQEIPKSHMLVNKNPGSMIEIRVQAPISCFSCAHFLLRKCFVSSQSNGKRLQRKKKTWKKVIKQRNPAKAKTKTHFRGLLIQNKEKRFSLGGRDRKRSTLWLYCGRLPVKG